MEKYTQFKARMMVKVPDAVVIAVLKRIKEGATADDVSKEFRIPKGTILGWANKTGLIVRRKRREWDVIKKMLGIE